MREWLDPRGNTYHEPQWILRGIDMDVAPGQAVGIIGRNGAGKSTLLKLIAGTTRPSEGQILKFGQCRALLELGLGFYPELTGRQNLRLAAQLQGHNHHALKQIELFVEEFSGLGSSLEYPLRTYSSGMTVRLAFSLAIAQPPDILVIDEALAVGDVQFQQQSFARIRELRALGTTLLVVSHDRNAILSLCDQAILLENNRLLLQGAPELVLDCYNALISPNSRQRDIQISQHSVSSGTGEARVISLELTDQQGQALSLIEVGQVVQLRAVVQVDSPLERLVFGYGLKDYLGRVMYGTNTSLKGCPLKSIKSGSRYRFTIEFPVNLGVGAYSIQTSLSSSETHLDNNYEWVDRALLFEVVNPNLPFFSGSNWLDPQIKIEQMTQESIYEKRDY